MTYPTALDAATRKTSELAVFRKWAGLRAQQFAAGDFDLHDGVDRLQAAAERHGLIAAFGQDAIQAAIAQPFARVRGLA
jgi:hypothetical protein